MNRINIKIPIGGMYQEWMSLIDLVEEENANELSDIATIDGWRGVQPEEAQCMGFGELVNWSKSKTDVLVGNDYLVCLNKNDFIVN